MATASPRRLDPCPCGSGRRFKDCHGSLRPGQPDSAAEALELRAAGRIEEAVACVEDKLRVAPDSAALLNIRGMLRLDAMDLDGAVADFEAAIARAPQLAEVHNNLGQVALMRGDYARGWQEYEWRTRTPGYADYANYPFPMPRWRGEPLSGRRILVHAEQGHGDTIQFARFLAPLAMRGAAVDIFCHQPLESLMSRIAGVGTATARLRERPTHDFHAPIIDVAAAHLPHASAPHWSGAYITPLPERVERFARNFAAAARPLVGVAWKGSARHVNDRNRSLERASAATLLRPGPTYVNLQLGEPVLDDAMIDAAADIADWDDTAAVVSLLDHVVSVDTAVAHLAGAMGKPVTLLVPFTPDWRWGVGGETTPWYPSMRLARQLRRADWSAPIEAATARLGALPG
ncbi:MAG TPA: tetratricopeptide repeat protein [Usitatibacter sp.]|nr:tetratricopeptide repeat protein [Usitatibacter sp.]